MSTLESVVICRLHPGSSGYSSHDKFIYSRTSCIECRRKVDGYPREAMGSLLFRIERSVAHVGTKSRTEIVAFLQAVCHLFWSVRASRH